MDEISIKNLSIINNKKGDILKGFLKSDNKNINVKEVYFSEINPKQIKAWKKHKKMTSNLIAVKGEIKIVVQRKDKSFITEIISKKNYKMVSIPPNFWFGFQCVGDKAGMLVNISNEEHDDLESDQLDIEKILFNWN
jgi:dTDP-4-dehydrorhamnose 3,5-epimerase